MAATTLETLARSAPCELSADIWADLSPFFEPGGCYQTPSWNNAVAEAGRLVGFRSFPDNLNAFLDAVLTSLTARVTA
jgi:hypothetical protein